MFRRPLTLFGAALLAVLGLVGPGSPAVAAPPTASWSGTAGGDVANVGLSVTGLTLANARLANSAASSSTTVAPRSQSISRNLAAAVAGLPITVVSNSQTAPPDNPGPVTGTLAAVSAVGIGVDALETSNEAHWAGDNACVTASPLAAATTKTAGVSINPLGLADLLTTDDASTTGTTALVSTGGNGLNRGVQSTARGSMAGVSVLGGAVTVQIAGQASLTATATGRSGLAIVGYGAPIVRVTEDGITQTVALGSSTTLDLGAVGSVGVAVNNPTVTTAANGTSATATVNVVTLTVRAGPAALPIANATIQLIPLRASAVSPVGGIDCPPPAPVLQRPADASVTNDSTPTFSGTGVAGAAIDLTIGSTTIAGAATVSGGGTWSYTPTTGIADGTYTASATQTLNGSTSPPSNENDFTIDSTPPPAPVVIQPANNSRTNDATPTLSGTAAASTEVEVFVDGNSVGTTTSTAGGNWQLTSPTLPDGSHTVYAVATDAAGNDSPQSNTNTFVVDTDEPAAPVIAAPADGSTITDTTPIVTGTGEREATVTVTIDGDDLGTVVVDGSGNWSLPVTTPLSQGSHTVEARQTDRAGNGSPTASNDFVIDSIAPAAPVVTAPANGSTTGATPTVRGTTEADAAVEVFVDGGSIGTTTANGSGGFQLVVPAPLAAGSHQVYVIATDGAGNDSALSNTNTFTVDLTAPDAPVLQAPANASSVGDSTPTFSGTAEAGSDVEIFVDGASIGTTTATGGVFSLDATTPLADGPHEAYAVATDAAGNDSAPSNTNTFTVDTDRPAPPSITTPADGSTITDPTPTVTGTGEVGATVTVSIDGVELGDTQVQTGGGWAFPVIDPLSEGPHTAVAVQTDEAGNESDQATSEFIVDSTPPAAPSVVTPANGATTGPTPTVSGTSDPLVEVEVFVDGNSIGTVTADGVGTWQLPVADPLNSGTHEVYAVASDDAGNESAASASNVFTVDADAPPAPILTTPADGSSTRDTTPTLSGTAQTGAVVEVFLDGDSIGTVTATGGTFSLDATAPLAAGSHEAYAVATDAVGNESGPSNTNEFTVDTTAPDAPAITSPEDGDQLDDPTPPVTGTAEPGSTVTVIVDGQPIGTTPADDDGDWTFTPTAPIPPGDREITATATDDAGNVSGPSAPVRIRIVAIADPVISTPVQDSLVTTPRPTIGGTGQPGSRIAVRYVTVTEARGAGALRAAPGDSAGTAAVRTDGTWSVVVPEALVPGTYTVQATQTLAPFAARQSNQQRFRIAAETPGVQPPVITTPTRGDETDASIQVCGIGEPGAQIRVEDEDGTSLGTTVVDDDGTWCVSVRLSAGEHRLFAVQTLNGTEQRSAPISIVVNPDSDPGSGSDDGGLASTGGPSLGLLALGLLLVGVGAVLVRRRGLL